MANTSTRRTVNRPGVGDGTAASGFQSPFQPPSADVDLAGDIAMLDPNAWHPVLAGGAVWRVKIASPELIGQLAEIMTKGGGAQVTAINGYLGAVMHPGDLAAMMKRMMNPNDVFDGKAFQDLWRGAVTVGTARPFQRSWGSFEPPATAGEPFEPSSLSRACRRHCSPSRPCTRCSTLWSKLP